MRVQYSIPDALEEQVRSISAENGITASQLVIAILRQWIRKGEPLVLVPAQADRIAPQASVKRSASDMSKEPQKRDRGAHAPLNPNGTLLDGETEKDGYFVFCSLCGTTCSAEKHDGTRHLSCPASP